MRLAIRCGIACLLLLLGIRGNAQGSRVEDGVFVDHQLRFSYPVPPGLTPFDLAAVARGLGQEKANRNENLLFAARAKTGAFGVVLLAERLGTDRKPPLTKPDDFLDALMRGSQYGSTAKRSHMKTATGVDLARLDWQTGGEFDSGIVFQAGQQLVCMKFNAPTAAALAQMTSTVSGIRFLP